MFTPMKSCALAAIGVIGRNSAASKAVALAIPGSKRENEFIIRFLYRRNAERPNAEEAPKT